MKARPPTNNPIEEKAARLGVSSHYIDASGRNVVVGDRTLKAVTAALAKEAPESSPFPRSIVIRGGPSPQIAIPTGIGRPIRWKLFDGLSELSGASEDDRIQLPKNLPNGVYQLHAYFEQSALRTAAVLITPGEAFQGKTATRRWLLAVQLFGIRSSTNWGHGDFTDLAVLLEIAASIGAAGVGLNPLHALMNEGTENVSPYSPSSRLFLNYLYIDVETLPEFGGIGIDDLRPEIERLRDESLVQYGDVAKLKDAALRRCYEHFIVAKTDWSDFESFRAERGEALREFARFEAIRQRDRRPWWEWPATQEINPSEVLYHQYVQWRADCQLRACQHKASALALPIGLYMDLAVGVRPDGADAWRGQDDYFRNLSIGAPPDPLNRNGQDWGLTAFDPRSLEQSAFKPFREMLSVNMRYAGALRIDHVLWLHRIYLIPNGFPPSEGCYIHCPLDSLLGALALESNTNRCVVIGEDLGTVSPELRDALHRWGVWRYHVMQFEREESGAFRAARSYQDRALASFSTHDVPPFAAWISGSDLDLKRELGIDPGETAQERASAVEFLSSILLKDGARPSFVDTAAFLAESPSRLVAVALEDALGLQHLTNIPGTIAQYPNWRLRLPISLEDFARNEPLHAVSAVFAKAKRNVSGSNE